MENASKALLIAAAVLIIVLLIAFGMRIFNDSSVTGDDAEQVAGSIKDGVDQANMEMKKYSLITNIKNITGTDTGKVKETTIATYQYIVDLAVEYNKYCSKANEKIYIGTRISSGNKNNSSTFVAKTRESNSEHEKNINDYKSFFEGITGDKISMKLTENAKGTTCEMAIIFAISTEIGNAQ